MAKEQGNSVGQGTLFVDVVDVECPEVVDVDVGREHGQLVEFFLVLAPVVPVVPTLDESLDICKWSAVCPVCILELVWECSEMEFFAENVELKI